jgi:cellulose synthase/poly-beta-1,6-N-acetylglucosamine synthase-like glycosyltransferase
LLSTLSANKDISHLLGKTKNNNNTVNESRLDINLGFKETTIGISVYDKCQDTKNEKKDIIVQDPKQTEPILIMETKTNAKSTKTTKTTQTTSDAQTKPQKSKSTLTVLIPMYNEEEDELKATLQTLALDRDTLAEMGFYLKILLVLDGWSKTHHSTKVWCTRTFPQNNQTDTPWWEAIKPIPAEADRSKCVSTFIIQRLQPNGTMTEEVQVDNTLTLDLTLLIKRDNRGKSNAHAWMMRSFAPSYKSEFFFLTDCGTQFEKSCVSLLLKELLQQKSCVAVTGMQRVMSKKQQGSQSNDEWLFGFKSMYRAAQGFDYYSSGSCFTFAFSFAGVLPVIPGPCGMFRLEPLTKAIKFYMKTMSLHPAEMSLLRGNCVLAEDRVLSAVAPMLNKTRAITTVVPKAIFYFQAEVTPKPLFTQRRRWNNGSLAGYIWLLSKMGMILTSKLLCISKPLLILLIVCQVFMFIGVAIAPALLFISLHWSLVWSKTYFHWSSEFLESSVSDRIHYGILLADALLYLFFVFKHCRPSVKEAVCEWLVHLVTIVNMARVIFMWTALIINFIETYAYRLTHWPFAFGADDWIVGLVFGSLILPFILALLTDIKAFCGMIRTAIPFYLFLPTMIATVGSYSFSRFWDLSWGNRVVEGSSMKSNKSKEDLEQNIKRVRSQGLFICYFVVVINLVIGFLVLFGNVQYQFLVGTALFVFSFLVVQMVFSLLGIIIRHLRELFRCFSYFFCVKCCRCYTKQDYFTRSERGEPCLKVCC